MTESQKKFIKNNSTILSQIFSDKISILLVDMLDGKMDKDVAVQVINELRSWLREIEIIKKGEEIKPTNFI